MIDVADNNTIYYYHFDGLGSVIALSDSAGRTVEMYEYDVYGNTIIRAWSDEPREVSLFANPYMFTGRRYDEETGLYYYRARYYAPYIGRFLQTDPGGYNDGLNLYLYVNNNAINLVDPYGLLGIAFGGSGTGGVFPVGATGGAQLVVDLQGNLGVFFHGGGGGYVGGSGSAMADLGVFGGTIFDLPGPFTSYGGSGGELGGGGLEVNLTDYWLSDLSGSAVTLSFGGFGGLPAEVHAFREYGAVYHFGHISDFIPSPGEIVEYWKDVGKKIGGRLKDVFDGSKK